MANEGFILNCKKRAVREYLIKEYFEAKTPNEFLKKALERQLAKIY